jgi:hypothetical protein
VLVDEPAKELVFGPNTKTALATVSGAPVTSALTYTVSNSNGSVTTTPTSIVDSGGVYGTILQSSLPGGASSVPDGTVITVYDGTTKLYQYTVESSLGNAPTVITSGEANSGYEPFSQMPIYLDYANNTMSFDSES